VDFIVELKPGSSKRIQIERLLREAIRSGRLLPGGRLPSSRVLADQLGVARGTVTEAYAQLAAEGYLVGRRGAGTQVSTAIFRALCSSAPIGQERPGARFDLRSGIPDAAEFPRHAWQRATAHALRTLPDAALVARHRGGFAPLRSALASHLALSRGTAAPAQHTVITAGLAYGLSIALGVLRRRGATRIAIEDPSWPLHAQAVVSAGLEPVMVTVDDQGLDVGALFRAKADGVIVTPAHQYPTGVVLSAPRRTALIDWAQSENTTILEDDYDAEYRYDRHPVAALQGLAPDHVILAGTVSKSLLPTLRIGWLVAPVSLAEDIERSNARLAAWPSLIEQAALARLFEQGTVQRQLRLSGRRYRARRDALADELLAHLDVRIGGAAAGLHLVAWLSDDTDEQLAIEQARERGVAVHGVHQHCSIKTHRSPGILLGYAANPEPVLREGVRLLASVPALAAARKSVA
jgi:GntR family transcriptional regulator/MocR family aminotransferase